MPAELFVAVVTRGTAEGRPERRTNIALRGEDYGYGLDTGERWQMTPKQIEVAWSDLSADITLLRLLLTTRVVQTVARGAPNGIERPRMVVGQRKRMLVVCSSASHVR